MKRLEFTHEDAMNGLYFAEINGCIMIPDYIEFNEKTNIFLAYDKVGYISFTIRKDKLKYILEKGLDNFSAGEILNTPWDTYETQEWEIKSTYFYQALKIFYEHDELNELGKFLYLNALSYYKTFTNSIYTHERFYCLEETIQELKNSILTCEKENYLEFENNWIDKNELDKFKEDFYPF